MRTTEELNSLIKQLEAELAPLPLAEEAWCRKRGELGKAQFELFHLLEQKDPSRAVWLLYEAAQTGGVLARDRLQKQKRPKQNAALTEKKPQDLDQLNEEELFKRGLQALSGVGIDCNPTLAFEYFQAGAEKGHAPSQNFLGWMFAYKSKALGLKSKDHTNAAKYYQLATEQGYCLSHSNIGFMYQKGLGFTENHTKALSHFSLAAAKGNSYAQRNIAVVYYDGAGVEQDLVMAAHFAHLANYQYLSSDDKHLEKFKKDLPKGIEKYTEDTSADAKKFMSALPHDPNLPNRWDVLIKAQLQERARYGSPKVFVEIAELWLNAAPNDESRKAFIKKLIDNPEGGFQRLLHVAHFKKSFEISSFFKSKATYVPPNWELVFKLIETFGADPNVLAINSPYPLLICYAAAFEEKHILEKLMKLGGNYKGIIDSESALMAAICGDKPENIDLLLEKGFSCCEVLFRTHHEEYRKKLVDVKGGVFDLQVPSSTFTNVPSQTEDARQVEYSCIPHEFARQIKEENYFTKKTSIINALLSILRGMENPERDRIKKEFNIPDELLQNDTQVKLIAKYDSLFKISIHKWEAELSSARQKLSLIKSDRIKKADQEVKAAKEAEKSEKKARDSALTNLQKIIAELNLIRIPAGAELSSPIIISIIELAAELDTEVSALKILEGKLPSFTISNREIKDCDSTRLIKLGKSVGEIQKSLKSEIAVLSVKEADLSETWTRKEKILLGLIEQLEEKIAGTAFNFDDPSAEVWCELRGQLAELQYHLFCLIEKKKPLEAVRLLWASFEIGYEPARTRLFHTESEASAFLLREPIDALSGNELFERGLQALAGVGLPINQAQAIQYFEAAALKGHARSQYMMGRAYQLACWGRKQDFAQALHYYKMAIENGAIIAKTNLGSMMEDAEGVEQNFPEAFKLYLASAETGSSAGLACLGDSYRSGLAGFEQNYALAVKCFRLSGKQGKARSLYALGRRYSEGEGVKQSSKEAFKYFMKAAELGNTQALDAMGAIYFRGELGQEDYPQAVSYFGQAADKGNVIAMLHLAEMYSTAGVGLDVAMAHYFFSRICLRLESAKTESDRQLLRNATKRLKAISEADLKEDRKKYKNDDLSKYQKKSSHEPKKSNVEIEAELHLRAESGSVEVFSEIAKGFLENASSEKIRKAREAFVKEKAQYLLAHTKNDKALEEKLIDTFGVKPELGEEKEKHIEALEKAIDELNALTEQFNSRTKGDLQGMKPDLVSIAGPLQDLMEHLCKKEIGGYDFGNLMSKGEKPLIKIEVLKSKVFSAEIDKLQRCRDMALGIKEAIPKKIQIFLDKKAAEKLKAEAALVSSKKPAVPDTVESLFGKDHSQLFSLEKDDFSASIKKSDTEIKSGSGISGTGSSGASSAPVIPASPAVVPVVPASPAVVPVVPASPAVVPVVPASPAVVPVVPASPAVTPVVPASVAVAPVVPASAAAAPVGSSVPDTAVTESEPSQDEVKAMALVILENPSLAGLILDEIPENLRSRCLLFFRKLFLESEKIETADPDASQEIGINEERELAADKVSSDFGSQLWLHLQERRAQAAAKDQNPMQNPGPGESVPEEPLDFSEILPSLESLDQAAGKKPRKNLQNPAPDFSSILPSLESLDEAARKKPRSNLQNPDHGKSTPHVFLNLEDILPFLESLIQAELDKRSKVVSPAAAVEPVADPVVPVKPVVDPLVPVVNPKPDHNNAAPPAEEITAEQWLRMLQLKCKSLEERINVYYGAETKANGLRLLMREQQKKAEDNKGNIAIIKEMSNRLDVLEDYIKLKRKCEIFVQIAKNTFENHKSLITSSDSETNGEFYYLYVIDRALSDVRFKEEKEWPVLEANAKSLITKFNTIQEKLKGYQDPAEVTEERLKNRSLLYEEQKKSPETLGQKIKMFFSNLWNRINPKFKGPAFGHHERLKRVNNHVLKLTNMFIKELDKFAKDNLPPVEAPPISKPAEPGLAESQYASLANLVQVPKESAKPKLAQTPQTIFAKRGPSFKAQYARYQELYNQLNKFGNATNEIRSLEKNPNFRKLNSLLDKMKLTPGASITLEAKRVCEKLIPELEKACERVSEQVVTLRKFLDNGPARAALNGIIPQGLPDKAAPNEGPTAWKPGKPY